MTSVLDTGNSLFKVKKIPTTISFKNNILYLNPDFDQFAYKAKIYLELETLTRSPIRITALSSDTDSGTGDLVIRFSINETTQSQEAILRLKSTLKDGRPVTWLKRVKVVRTYKNQVSNLEIYNEDNELLVGETATASGGSTGSGFWVYQHSSISGQQIPSDTWSRISNNLEGPETSNFYASDGIIAVMEPVSGSMLVSSFSAGTTLLIRNDLEVNASTENTNLSFRYRLGIGGTEYYITKQLPRTPNTTGGANLHGYSFTDLVYLGDANTIANPIELQIKAQHSCSIASNKTVINKLN